MKHFMAGWIVAALALQGLCAFALEPSKVVGIYKGMMPSAGCCGQDLTLYLNVDQTVRLVTDFMNDEPAHVEIGTWEVNAADAVVKVTLTGMEDGDPYNPPSVQEFAFQDRQLTSLDDDEGSLKEEFLEFTSLAANEKALPYDAAQAEQMIRENGFVGIYKGMLPAATCCGQDLTLYLNDDQTVNFVTNFMNGKPPIVEQGTWEAQADHGVVVTLGGQRAYQFELVDGVLLQKGVDGALDVSFRSVEAIITVILSHTIVS